jgi:hypothetical protein
MAIYVVRHTRDDWLPSIFSLIFIVKKAWHLGAEEKKQNLIKCNNHSF